MLLTFDYNMPELFVSMLQLQKQRNGVALMETVLSSSVNVSAVDYVSETQIGAEMVNIRL